MSVQTFISEIAPIIKREASARGYKVCSTVIAQAIVESRYGESGLAKYGNYFGLKCGSSWKGTSVNMKTKEEYSVGVLTTISDNFRTYLKSDGTADMAVGVKGYYDFISTKRYANLKTAKNHIEYANYLKMDGYATSSSYVSTLTKTVTQYSLTSYDDGYDSTNISLPAADDYIVGKTYTLDANLYIRISPGGDKIDYYSITTNAQLNAYTDKDGCSILKKGTRVTCKNVMVVGDKIWLEIPSGWVCGNDGNKKLII